MIFFLFKPQCVNNLHWRWYMFITFPHRVSNPIKSVCISRNIQLIWYTKHCRLEWQTVYMLQYMNYLVSMMTSSNFKQFPHYWPFVQAIHWSPVNSPHKGQWRGALIFPLICASKNAWVSNREAGDLKCHRTNYDVIVMCHHYSKYMN